MVVACVVSVHQGCTQWWILGNPPSKKVVNSVELELMFLV